MIKLWESPGYDGQKPGTSGLRKKTKVFMDGLYLPHFIQSIFSIPSLDLTGGIILVSGDGRYYNRAAIEIICKVAAGNGISRVLIGKCGLVSTPAASLIVRNGQLSQGVSAAILLTASHNPGGINEDFGVKLNDFTGGPAKDAMTTEIEASSRVVKQIKYCELPKIDIDTLGEHLLLDGKFAVEIMDPVEDWLQLMYKIFDFSLIASLINRPNFSMIFDGLNGVGGIYAKRLFIEVLGIPEASVIGCTPLEDFGGKHPDPNLVYAKSLADKMGVFDPSEVNADTPEFGAAVDGDADRNMILGKGIFVSPGDSVAVITDYAQKCIPYFKEGVVGVARSMPTSKALDQIAKKLGIALYETPVGWKYFVNLMDAKKVSICGEESFGTSSNHIREKDGLWAILCWLSILAYCNIDTQDKAFVSIRQIMTTFWEENGRNYYSRYDYETVDTGDTNSMMNHLRTFCTMKTKISPVEYPKLAEYVKHHGFECDEFTYSDPFDGSVAKNQGIRFVFDEEDRIIWRVSGTGSEASSIRVYFEKYEKDAKRLNLDTAEAITELVAIALECSKIAQFTGRNQPSVIT